MTPRPLELFDLPKLPQLRSELVSLDCRQVLTRGNPLRAVNFIAHLNPIKKIYTAIHEHGRGQALLGSIRQHEGENFARLTYLSPADADEKDLLVLIGHLVQEAKHWQAYQVVAEVREDSSVFQPLRHSGFAIYTRQRVWDMSDVIVPEETVPFWRRAKDIDSVAIKRLLHQIVPPLLQQVESFDQVKDGVRCNGDELLAYVDIKYGGRGIFLRPLLHPNADQMRAKLTSLLAQNISHRRERPVYFCVRSYQAWVEPLLEAMEANPGPRQVVMVKHLAKFQRTEKTVPAGVDVAWSNPATSIQSSEIKKLFNK